MGIATNGAVTRLRAHTHARPEHYKWVALSNTTLGILMATINQSIVIIALPAIFRGIRLDPLVSSNTSYLLWMLLGFLVVSAVLVVSLGRVGDMFGRVRMYNLGFAVFTAGSILLSVTWMRGSAGALWMIVMRVVQAHTVPSSPTGTDTRNTSRQDTGASTPPSTRPMNDPAIAATMLIPSVQPALLRRERVGQDRRRVSAARSCSRTPRAHAAPAN